MAQKEHRQIYPAARLGGARRRGDLDQRRGGDRRARWPRPALDAADVAAVGITNQRETTLVWDKATGKPIANAIVWQDTRTDRLVAELGGEVGQDRFRAACGLPLATYFSGPKMRWLLDDDAGRARRGPSAASCCSAPWTPG